MTELTTPAPTMAAATREQPLGTSISVTDARLNAFARICFGLAMIGFGAIHLVYQDFVAEIVPPWPAWVPGRTVWACLLGGVLLVAGGLIAFGRLRTRSAALCVVGILGASLLLLHLPGALATPGVAVVWTNPLVFLALAGGAFLIAGLYPDSATSGPAPASPGLGSRLWLARVLLGGCLAFCGGEHFVYTTSVAALIPTWIPGKFFWTYFAGVALIAGGLGMVIPKVARLAAGLSGLMLFIWFLILHIPRAVAAGRGSPAEWASVCEALAISGVAFLISGSAGLANPRSGAASFEGARDRDARLRGAP